jgi:hypothetical protein
MNFTFGIITSGNNLNNINIIIDSIEKQNIPNYEIIIVGGEHIERKNVIHVTFDENIKKMWITKKKNIITNLAKYDNIVYMHDYIKLNNDWYSGFLKYGNDFKICMTIILNIDNSRYRDWTLWADDMENIVQRRFLIPYSITHLSKYMYISGAYWVAKKHIMLEFPLNENLSWGEGEDVEWSKRIRQKYDFSINANSSVKLLKYKWRNFDESISTDINILKNIK